MAPVKVYDQVAWHYPEGRGCPSLDAAKRHLRAAMKWLQINNLLSDYGEEIYNVGVDRDFALTSDMLTIKGNEILSEAYQEWLRQIDYRQEPDMSVLDGLLNN